MKTLSWKHTDWFGKTFIFFMGQEMIGQLTFQDFFNFRAAYTNRETNFNFATKSFWDRDVVISKDGKAIGEIQHGLFGEQRLKLTSGEKFVLSTSFWEQEAYWKNERGQTIIRYRQAAMSAMGKGVISLDATLTEETESLLISSGLFARQMRRKRVTFVVLVTIPVLAVLRQL
jgi:hypothetical protein